MLYYLVCLACWLSSIELIERETKIRNIKKLVDIFHHTFNAYFVMIFLMVLYGENAFWASVQHVINTEVAVI